MKPGLTLLSGISIIKTIPYGKEAIRLQDFKAVLPYLKPYRKDLWLAIVLVFVECIF